MQAPLARLVQVALSFAVVLAPLGCTPKEKTGGTPDDDKKPRICTEMACFDAATITTTLSPAGAPLGTHSFALDVDGTAQTCTVEFVDEKETAHGECSGGASLFLGPAMQGKEESMDGVVSYHEEPIPGEFRWQLTVEGRPVKIGVVHTHAGNTLLERTAELGYVDHRPNGPHCEPVCKAASVEWKGP
jgi:hypothetical protein